MNANVMQLFQSLASGNLDSVGTLADFVGQGGRIRFNDSNFADTSKTLMLDITSAAGIKGRIFASKNVGEAIRSKSLTVPQLLGLRVIQGKTKDGSDTLKLVGWESSGTELLVTNIATEQAPAMSTKSVANLEDLGI